MFQFQKWIDFLKISGVGYPKLVLLLEPHMFFRNIFIFSTNGVTITINHALLANLFHLLDEGCDLYLSYYDSLHDLHFGRITIYQSIFGPFTIEHTGCLQKNIIRALKVACLILSYNFVLQQIKNIVSQVSIFVLHYLHATYEFTLFYHKRHVCGSGHHLSNVSSIWCLVDSHFDQFRVNCSGEQSESISKPFDKTTISKSLS